MSTAILSKEQKQQERLAYCVENLQVCEDTFGTFAKVPSTTDQNISYRVDIDESHGVPFATHCSCTSSKPECIHYQAVDLFYQQIAAIFAKEELVKEPVIRNIIQQYNRVWYQVLDTDSQEYYSIQMENGRAMSCIDHLGKKCQHRRQHAGVPCPHMEVANRLESDFREQARIAQVIASGDFKTKPEELQQLTQQEVAKCEEAYKAVMREPINEVHGTPEYWQAIKRRQKKANKAYRLQREKSEQLLSSVAQEAA